MISRSKRGLAAVVSIMLLSAVFTDCGNGDALDVLNRGPGGQGQNDVSGDLRGSCTHPAEKSCTEFHGAEWPQSSLWCGGGPADSGACPRDADLLAGCRVTTSAGYAQILYQYSERSLGVEDAQAVQSTRLACDEMHGQFTQF